MADRNNGLHRDQTHIDAEGGSEDGDELEGRVAWTVAFFEHNSNEDPLTIELYEDEAFEILEVVLGALGWPEDVEYAEEDETCEVRSSTSPR